MNPDSGDNWYVIFCRFSGRIVDRLTKKPKQKPFSKKGWIVKKGNYEDLNSDLKFSQLELQPFEVFAGAKFFAVILLSIMIFIDIFLIFALIDIPIKIDGYEYNSIDLNEDGYNDFIEEIIIIEDIEYDRFGIETGRTTLGYYGRIDFGRVFLFLILPTIMLPFISAVFFLGYPKSSVKRMRTRSLSSMPGVVNYMTMSLRLTPSLESAVQFTADNMQGHLSESLKKLLWDVYLRSHNTIESAFGFFAEEWGKWNESFKRSMYMLRSSVLERSEQGRRMVLEKANSVILTGVSLELNKFAAVLNRPSMFLFAFGIIIPIIIATILPIMGIGMDSVLWVVILMDVFLPLVCFIYSRKIIFNRPSMVQNGLNNNLTKKNLDRDSLLDKRSRFEKIKDRLPFIFACTSFISLFFLGLWIILHGHTLFPPRTGALIMIISFSWPASIYLYGSVKDSIKKRKRLIKMDNEFPDALFQIGTRIAEGKPLERAFEETAVTLKGSVISEMFSLIMHRVRVSRASIAAVLYSDVNIKSELSSTIYATLKVVVQAVEKNSSDAGEIIIDISNYLRDLRTMDENLKQRLSEVLGTVKQTGLVFSPVIIGLTTAMYFMLNANLAKIDFQGGLGFGGFGATEPIPGEMFLLIFGIYLILTLIVIIYFVCGMESADDQVLFKERLSYGLISGPALYVISCLAGFYIFGF